MPKNKQLYIWTVQNVYSNKWPYPFLAIFSVTRLKPKCRNTMARNTRADIPWTNSRATTLKVCFGTNLVKSWYAIQASRGLWIFCCEQSSTQVEFRCSTCIIQCLTHMCACVIPVTAMRLSWTKIGRSSLMLWVSHYVVASLSSLSLDYDLIEHNRNPLRSKVETHGRNFPVVSSNKHGSDYVHALLPSGLICTSPGVCAHCLLWAPLGVQVHSEIRTEFK